MKNFKLFFAVLISMLIMSGCASSSKNAPEEVKAANKAYVSEETTDLALEASESEFSEAEETESTESLEETESDEISSEATISETSEAAEEEPESDTERITQKQAEEPKAEEPKAEEPRIIATSASICDIMDRLGIDLIGVPETSVSSIASRYSGVTTVGSAMSPDMEIIKSLNPTDVISPDTLKNDLQIQYENIGVNYTFVNLRSIEGLYDAVKLIGDKYGKSAEAAEIINEYNEFMSSWSSKHEGQKPKVLVLMGLPGSYLAATQNSYAGSLVELAGGENIFHDDAKDFLTVNPEEMLSRDPDIIIRTAHGLPKEALEMFEKEFSSNDIWKHFRAVQNNKVYDVDYMLFGMSAGFDYPQALAALEPIMFGD